MLINVAYVPGAWLGAPGQLLSAAKHNNEPISFAHDTGSHANLESPVKGFAGPVCRVPGQVVGWLFQSKNCHPKFSRRFLQHQPLPPTPP
eukprot:1159497-Pelagomonas_calceolata.AAC.5